ncbi:hypothetical protein D3C78_1503250 [compost metagenome]
MEFPNFEDAYVCRETIYNAIYALPVGELRKELIIYLRQGKTTRRPCSGDVDRRGPLVPAERSGILVVGRQVAHRWMPADPSRWHAPDALSISHSA